MKILCIGQSSYDITLPVDAFPKENMKQVSSGRYLNSGGSASNAAKLLAKWGLDTYFAGSIGNDYFGQRIIEEYNSLGLKTDYLEVKKQDTTLSVILTNNENNTRTIIKSKEINEELNEPDVIENFDVLYFDGSEETFSMKMIEKYPNAIKIIDADSIRNGTVKIAYKCDYVVCSKVFAEEYTQMKIDASNIDTVIKAYDELSKIFKNVIITLEKYGSFSKIDGNYKLVPSIKVQSKDSTGAGDIYHASFTYSVINKFDLEKAMYFSNIAAALSIQKIGVKNSLPELEAVERIYNATI